MDCATTTEIIPNAEPVMLDNECFSGKVRVVDVVAIGGSICLLGCSSGKN